ncbi:hypothetical protein ACWEJQ_10885 [Streptomyces albidoflavus]
MSDAKKLLTDWRARQPAFDAAMAAAKTLASPPADSRPPAPSPAALGLLLRTVASGTTIAGAIESLGLSARVVRRLRELNPGIDALVVAASGRRRRRRAMRRTTRTPGARLAYRLVEREE